MTTEIHNMDHLNHIDGVAASDCAVLRDKEATYKGSWKRAGGRSAWFMARRNMDRLIQMLAPPTQPPVTFNLTNVDDTIKAVEEGYKWPADKIKFPGSPDATLQMLRYLRDSYTAEDIFAKIEAQPGGEDGTPLACIRDLRRYLTLVEAEMVSRGVINQQFPVAAAYQPPAHDVYQLIADEKGLTRREVKDRIHTLFYDEPGPQPPIAGRPLLYTSPITVTIEVKQFDRAQSSRYEFPNAQGVVITPNSDSLFISLDMGMHPPPFHQKSAGEIRRDVAAGVDAVVERRGPPTPRSPEAGSHHSSVYPWSVSGEEASVLRSRIGDELFKLCYNQRGTNDWRLEPVIVNHTLPKELASVYSLMVSVPSSYWLLKRSMIPADLQDEYPRLQIEMNAFEYDTSRSEFKFMYHPVGEKMILQQCYMDWAVQN